MDDNLVKFELDEVSKRSLYKAFKTMDENSKSELKNAVTGISSWVARDIKFAAADSPFPRQASAVATTVRPVKDRIPYIRIGGEAKVTSTGARVGDLLIGAEFGGPTWFKNGGRRFPFRSPRLNRGNAGYWIYPTLKRSQARITHEWKAAIEQYVIRPWGRA